MSRGGAQGDDRAAASRLEREPSMRAVCRSAVLRSITRRKGESPENLALMRRIDELFLKYPFYGSRQMVRQLRREGARRRPSSGSGA